MAFINIHTHKNYSAPEIITVQNIYPGEGFGAFRENNYFSVGLHPWHIKTDKENNILIQQIEKTCEFDHVIFIGECGLDKLCNTNFDEQKRVFIHQIELAEKLKKPVIIHCVKAHDELLSIRKKMKVKTPWILHGYRGNYQQAEQLAKHGFMFSFGKILFSDDTKAIKTFRKLPDNIIFLETDEFSGSIKDIYKKASEIRRTDILMLAKIIESNFNLLSGII